MALSCLWLLSPWWPYGLLVAAQGVAVGAPGATDAKYSTILLLVALYYWIAVAAVRCGRSIKFLCAGLFTLRAVLGFWWSELLAWSIVPFVAVGLPVASWCFVGPVGRDVRDALFVQGAVIGWLLSLLVMAGIEWKVNEMHASRSRR